MRKSPVKPKKIRKYLFIAVILFSVLLLLWIGKVHAPETSFTVTKDKEKAEFNKSQKSINDPTSTWVVVNKGRTLPADYVPPDLVAPNVPLRLHKSSPDMQMRSESAKAVEQMFDDAKKEGINLMVASAYRSYRTQSGLYNGYVKRDGQDNADLFSARAGHSEHQTGLAVDVEPTSRKCEVEQCFADLVEGKWVIANSYKYGFIIRYQQGKQHLTGYEYEPWHLRYVGVDLAEQIHKTDQTLEQFFGLPAANDYSANPFQLKVGS